MSDGFLAPYNADYQNVPASTTVQLAGQSGQGRQGNVIERLLIIPATTSPGAVTITDGGGSAITVFTGGNSSVADLRPFWVNVGARSAGGAWQLTTGANVSVIAVGRFI